MARPRNVVVTLEGAVYSVAPKKLREYLEATISGASRPSLADFLVGVPTLPDLGHINVEEAKEALAAFTPKSEVPVATPAEVPAAAIGTVTGVAA